MMQKTFTPSFSSSISSASTNDASASYTSPIVNCALLPAIYYTKAYKKTFMSEDDMTRFLKYDLGVARLNYIHEKLWLVGRSMHYNSLHRQKMMKRKIVITEQTDLHLIWYKSTIYIKSFFRYLDSHEFWTAHFCEPMSFMRLFPPSTFWLKLFVSFLGRFSCEAYYHIDALIRDLKTAIFEKYFDFMVGINFFDAFISEDWVARQVLIWVPPPSCKFFSG